MTSSRLTLPTRCAHWGHSDHRYFGHAVFDELTGHETSTGLTALSVLGRRLPREYCDMLDDIACISTLADPRIWPLKITRLVASYGSVMPAVAAGLTIQQGALVTPWQAAEAALTLQELNAEVAEQSDDPSRVRLALDARFARRGAVSGFGMPCRNTDERLVALRACVQRRDRAHFPYWRLLSTIIEGARPLRRFAPNIGLGIAATMLDMDIAVSEIGPLTSSLFQHMYVANALEAARDSAADLREMPHEYVTYSGVPPRVSPRAQIRTSFIRPTAAFDHVEPAESGLEPSSMQTRSVSGQR